MAATPPGDGETATGRAEPFPRELLAADPGSGINPLMAATPWAATPLGPVAGWPAELRSAVGICLNSPFPMLIMWGPDLAMVYNDAFVPILGAKHPALGAPCPQVWSDAWPVVGGWIGAVMAGGPATYREDLPLTVRRHGFDEAVHFTFAYSAIPVAGGVGGVFTVVTETTGQVLGARRLETLRELGEARTSEVTDARQACVAAMRVLRARRDDIVRAAVYLLDEDGERARRVARTGPPGPGTPALPGTAIAAGEHGWIWRAASTGTAWTRHGPAAGLTAPAAGDGPPPPVTVALPLAASGGGTARGAVVLTVSPSVRPDDTCWGFLNLAADHIARAVADAGAREAQARRVAELAELDRAKTRFFTSVSHELRTPLTLIAGPAQDALAEGGLPGRQRERVELIHRNAGRLRRLVDTLLDLGRIEAGRLRAEPVAVDLAALTRGVAESFAPAVHRAGLRLTIDCPPAPRAVLADPDLWERIVLNLLSNAVKFTPRGDVRVALRDTGDDLRLEVADTGVGIEPGELPHIFERFHRARATGVRAQEGSGIGLALVRELAALHDGSVHAVSHPGRGTTFTVTLPARPAPTAPAAPGSAPRARHAGDHLTEALPRSDPADAPGAPPPGTADTVLVAEDHADLRRYLTGLLAPHYAVTVAADGRDALERARRQRPDLVLADVMMPGLDGFALLKALRADPATAGTAVVLLSARAGEEAAAEGLAAGADDYLAKPFSSADLLARVRSNLDLARLRTHESAWRTALVNALQDGFFVAGPDLTVIEINDAFTELLGYGAAGLPWPAPHPWWPAAATDPEGFALVTEALATVGERGRGRFVLPLRHRDGRRLWADVSLDSLRDRTGRGRLLLGTLRDVTAQHLTAGRDAAVARLAGRLAGIDDTPRLTRAALAGLREAWQAARVSLLRWPGPGADPGPAATTGPRPPSGTALPPARAERDAREGRIVTAGPDSGVTAVGAPVYDGTEPALVWIEFATPRPFGVAERTSLIQLTGHVQSALSRARAFDDQQRVALALQRAILGPTDLPACFAVRYEPAGSTLEVGGDWYDVVPLPGGRYGVVVGDVVGSGLTSAATMGQLRSAARALLLENNGPARVLRSLDRFGRLLEDAFCSTLFCAVIDPASGTVRYSSAGHPPALLVRPGQEGVQQLEDAQSVPLAVLGGPERPEATAAVPPGALLLLYTDGLVERRDEAIDTGIARAARALAAGRALPTPQDVADHLCARLLGTAPHEDDVALLVYRQP